MNQICSKAYGGLLALLLVAILSFAPVAHAQQSASNKQEAVQIAVLQSGGNGKVLGVELEKQDNGSAVFSVKILNNGRVRVFRIPQGR
ncbi:MAG: PepSY domain-containing protein [Granulosicoccus sp.]